MKRRYQIDKQRALLGFRKQAQTSGEEVQFALPLPEVLNLAQEGLMKLALAAFVRLTEGMMQIEVKQLAGPKNRPNPDRDKSRWGAQPGYCVMGGQKLNLDRPRVRDVRNNEVPLGSYEMLQRASLMEESVWRRIMGGLTTRRYGEVVREPACAQAATARPRCFLQPRVISENYADAPPRPRRGRPCLCLQRHIPCIHSASKN